MERKPNPIEERGEGHSHSLNLGPWILGSLVFLAFLIIPCLGTNAQTEDYPMGHEVPALIRDMHLKVNAYREAHGLSPLSWDSRIEPIALKHSRLMTQGKRPPGHEGMEKRMEDLQKAIPGVRGMAENIVIGPADAQRLFDEWVKSKVHRKNLLGDYASTAMAMDSDAQGKVYITQIFVRY